MANRNAARMRQGRAMEATTRRKADPRQDPRLSAARGYMLRMLECVAQAGTLFRMAAADHTIAEPLDRAARLAENGLGLIESSCGERLPAGWAGEVIKEIAALKILMIACPEGGRSCYKDLPEVALENLREHILLLMRSMPPEGAAPAFVSSDDGLRVSESLACRVILQGQDADNQRAVVDGREVEPPLTPRMYRLLARLILAGPAGLTKDQLGSDRPAVSELLACDGWSSVLQSPGKRGSSKCPASTVSNLPKRPDTFDKKDT
jgi:hypothetical protein